MPRRPAQDLVLKPMGTDIGNLALLRKHRMIVFGEVHGTNEVPELVSAVTYELAKEGARILMALEVPDLLNGELADFVAGTTSDDRFLAGEAFWNRPLTRQDGRSSRAMLRLLQDVREYRSRGLTIDARGIDSIARSAREREASMALNLRTLVDNLPYDHVVVLTGRWHACRSPRFLGVGPRPMASYFRRGELFLVHISFLGGSSWHCRRRGTCGVHDLPAISNARPLNRVNSLPPNDRRARRFDAEIVLASATPSSPACRLPSGSSPHGGSVHTPCQELSIQQAAKAAAHSPRSSSAAMSAAATAAVPSQSTCGSGPPLSRRECDRGPGVQARCSGRTPPPSGSLR